MLKKIVIGFFSMFFPWAVLLVKDNPGGAFVALIMQVTVLGWPFASLWAYRTAIPEKKASPIKE